MSYYDKENKKRYCISCKKRLTRYQYKYCSLECKVKFNNTIFTCLACNKEFIVKNSSLRFRKPFFCSYRCVAIFRRKSGGEYIDSSGYIRIGTADYSKKDNRVRKHRLVMEKYLDRKLKSFETIHHIDGNKTNNDIGNLKLVSHSEHAKLHHLKKTLKSYIK